MKSVQYSDIGKKTLNEDSYGSNSKCFIVCDGVGGADRGEVASEIVVQKMMDYTKKKHINSEEGLRNIVSKIKEDIAIQVSKKKELKGMATTLAFIYLSEHGLFTGHVGDSRIILISNKYHGYWQTLDHSIVATMVRMGEITEDEARNHPLKNQITNAIIADAERTKGEVELNFVSDLYAGDLVFVCSDGVLEAYSETELIEVLTCESYTLDEKLFCIKEKCAKLSNDNNTAILVELEEGDVEGFNQYPFTWKIVQQSG